MCIPLRVLVGIKWNIFFDVWGKNEEFDGMPTNSTFSCRFCFRKSVFSWRGWLKAQKSSVA